MELSKGKKIKLQPKNSPALTSICSFKQRKGSIYGETGNVRCVVLVLLFNSLSCLFGCRERPLLPTESRKKEEKGVAAIGFLHNGYVDCFAKKVRKGLNRNSFTNCSRNTGGVILLVYKLCLLFFFILFPVNLLYFTVKIRDS